MNPAETAQGSEAQERQPLLARFDEADIPELSPQTVTRLIRRLRALVFRLLPIEVNKEVLYSPTSSVINKQVVDSFKQAGGDFQEAVPFCLLKASVDFSDEAQVDPASYDESMSRSAACEVLARRVLQTFHHTRQHLVLSARYACIESDGDVSYAVSAIELASDAGCGCFLSSDVCQRVTFALWKGHIIQDWDVHGHTIYRVNPKAAQRGFMAHFEPSRLTAIPRWQNWLRIALWLLFLVAYSVTLKTPDRAFGPEDVIFYIQIAGYVDEEVVRLWKIGPRAAMSFWSVVNYMIYAISIAAFVLRIMDLRSNDPELAVHYRRLSFYVLSMAAPLIWGKLLTVFDVYPFFGTMQIVVFRMMKESVIFFFLLTLLALGFAQALIGLDSSDQTGSDSTVAVLRSLTESLLGSPSFDIYAPDGYIAYPFGLIQYYLWTMATCVILLNVLVALFGTAYDSIVGDAANQYLVFFTGKVISLIRTPDQYVYPAPFNLVELCIVPFERFVSKETYAKINSTLMSIIFFPLICIGAFYEGHMEITNIRKESILLNEEETGEENPDEAEADKSQGSLSKVPFDQLANHFPDLEDSPNTAVLQEIKRLHSRMDELEAAVKSNGNKGGKGQKK